MRAYEAALGEPRHPIGAKRSKPGSVNAAIAGYYTSLEFRSLAAGTQKMRRAILERFRTAHGDKPMALLPQKFIAHVLSTMKPHRRAQLVEGHPRTLCSSRRARDVRRPIRRKALSSDASRPTAITHGPTPRSRNSRRTIRSVARPGWRSRSALHRASSRRCVAMGRSTFAMACSPCGRTRPAARSHPRAHRLDAILDATPSATLTFLTTEHGKPFGGRISAISFASGATRPGCEGLFLRTDCARRHVDGSRKRDAAPTRSPPISGTRACARSSATRRRRTKSAWRAMRSIARRRTENNPKPAQAATCDNSRGVNAWRD